MYERMHIHINKSILSSRINIFIRILSLHLCLSIHIFICIYLLINSPTYLSECIFLSMPLYLYIDPSIYYQDELTSNILHPSYPIPFHPVSPLRVTFLRINEPLTLGIYIQVFPGLPVVLLSLLSPMFPPALHPLHSKPHLISFPFGTHSYG